MHIVLGARSLADQKHVGRALLFYSPCCAPTFLLCTTISLPDIMGKELRLRQQNFGSFSTGHVFLREDLRHEQAKEILGATCTVLEDKTKLWYVKMPEFVALEDGPTVLADS